MEAKRMRSIPPVHPGEYLRADIVHDLAVPASDLAIILGVSRNQLYRIMRCEQAVTPEVAVKLSDFLGTTPDLWLNLQHDWDIAIAKRSEDSALAKLRRKIGNLYSAHRGDQAREVRKELLRKLRGADSRA